MSDEIRGTGHDALWRWSRVERYTGGIKIWGDACEVLEYIEIRVGGQELGPD